MKIIKAELSQRLNLGVQGEHLVQEFGFDTAAWREIYGAGSIQLLIQRPGDAEPYQAVLQREKDLMIWEVTHVDTAISGNVDLQLLYFVDGRIVKSQCFTGVVARSLGKPMETLPPDHQSFAEKVAQDAARAENAAENAEKVVGTVERSAQQADTAAKHAALAQQGAEAARDEAAKHDTAAGNAQKAAELARDDAAGSAKLASDTVAGFDQHADAEKVQLTALASKEATYLTELSATEQTKLTQLATQEKQAISDLSRQNQNTITQLGTSQRQQMMQQSEQEQQKIAQSGTDQRRQLADLSSQVQDAIARDKAEVQSLAEQTRQNANAVAQAVPIVAQDADKAAAAAKNAEKAAVDADNAAGRSEAGASKVEETVAGYNADLIQRLCTPFDTTAPIVTCHPVTAHPLHVVSHIEPNAGGHTGAKLWCVGKNLLNLAGREIITANPYTNTTKRSFNGKKAYIGLSGTNYFNNGKIKNYSLTEDTVSLEIVSAGYGIGFDFMATPGAQIVVSPNVQGKRIDLSFYTKDGAFLSRAGAATIVPEGACWGVAIFMPNVGSVETYKNPQLEVGTKSTPYEPYQGAGYSVAFDELVEAGTYEWDTGLLAVTAPTPHTKQFASQQIFPRSGTNSLYSNTGETAVQGYVDPIFEKQQLRDAIVALGIV